MTLSTVIKNTISIGLLLLVIACGVEALRAASIVNTPYDEAADVAREQMFLLLGTMMTAAALLLLLVRK